jgi:predicted amidohydrolase YtcJ
MKVFMIILSLFVISWVVSCGPEAKKEMADLVFLNGVVWTVNPEQPRAEAVAIKGEKVLAVGSSADLRELIGEETEVIDLKGKFLLPGFIDSHTHFLDGGFALSRVQLREAKSREDFIARIGERAKELGEGEWILDGDWDHQQFDPPELPRREWIDGVTLENPVCVNRHDGHMVLANSAALALAEITSDTPSPDGGEIMKDPETGEPTGILKDAAMDLLSRHIPEPSMDERIRAAEAALNHAREKGVTSVHDMAYVSNYEVYQELLKENKLTARLTVYTQITDVDRVINQDIPASSDEDFLKIAGLKGFADGSLGSSTALFFEPYSDNPDQRGLLYSHMYPEGIMEERIMKADRAGLQVAVHAIGDKANHIILDIYEKAIRENKPRDRRWRIEHAQHLLPEDMKRMAKLRVIASVQPYHAIDDGRWAEKKIGIERCRTTYAFHTLMEDGVVLACGSDWTVAPLDPLTGIYAAVTRCTLDGKNPEGWFPEQKLSLEEAIRGYTINGAYAEFSEKSKGSVEKGKWADLVVLDQNLFEISPEKIPQTRVMMTVLNGSIIFKR